MPIGPNSHSARNTNKFNQQHENAKEIKINMYMNANICYFIKNDKTE